MLVGFAREQRSDAAHRAPALSRRSGRPSGPEGPVAQQVVGLQRERLAGAPAELLNRGNRGNPDVLLVELDGRRIVVKDFAPRGRLVRATIGRWLTAREVRAYRALAEHPAVPRFLGRVDALAFAVAYCPGRRMARSLAAKLPADFLPRLEEAVRVMHERGVVHLDLRHRSNLLVGDDGRPILIDFASAVCLRPDGWLGRLLLPCLARFDQLALQKWRARLTGQRPPAAGRSANGRGASRPT